MRAARNLLTALFACSLLSSCYYGQLLSGQWQVLSQAEPIGELLQQADLDPVLRRQLALVQAASSFAGSELLLPQNASYQRYADLGRDYVVWNVYAAPEFSVAAHQWCYLIVGCLAYRGYFDMADAQRYAQQLAADGLDTHVGPVAAYSTLGWFDDPLLNTMLRRSDASLAGLVFHELAHQMLFVEGDTAFNESYASFVELQGLRSWLVQRDESSEQIEIGLQRQAQFAELVVAARSRLQKLYQSALPAPQMRARKQAVIEQLRADYQSLRETRWQGADPYQQWFADPINNAKLNTVALYNQWLPAFERLYRDNGSDWARFHLATAVLAAQSGDERLATLRRLLEAPGGTDGD